MLIYRLLGICQTLSVDAKAQVERALLCDRRPPGRDRGRSSGLIVSTERTSIPRRQRSF